ncbi:sensor histidine kinase [Candidatus Galacturonibacter soehngenii]|uniref:histidine kinase n=1 Tax=Candidatus Galacturonatibacter soehngenii TaxID=2307010 RepID=A0A7V7QN90_9FIRM|nr:HAMP domain-containing sensor histidine kinase [Candidatus Galacturonibacter soehngenii]KAB1440441.1 cell wall metabolism sensor histidine kinase WalK [Candidatus Galacturonibacter soehngenii]MBA4688066.1 ATP-binding protein [Candidatus Galacturonibacter soehngenii]
MLVLSFVGIVPGVLLKNGIIDSYEDRAVLQRSIDVSNQCKILSNQIYTYGYLTDSYSEVINAEVEQLAGMLDGRIMVIDNTFKIVKDTYVLEQGKTIVSEEVIKCFKGTNTSKYMKKDNYISLTVPITDTITKETIGVILVSMSTDNIKDSIVILQQKATVLQLGMGIVILTLAFYLARILVKPFARVSNAIEALNEGYINEKISVSDYTETELISDAFNKMMGRMKVLDDSRQEFVSNVSHELKTPLTSMKVLADSLIAQEDVPTELYKEFMVDIAEEIDRENKIINDLLALVKLDKTAADLNITTVNINGLLELILKRLRPIAAKQNIELLFESFRPVTAEIDEVKITLAISNLVENAIKYNTENGWVHVSLNADHKYFYIKVADSGIGIPEESLEHIYERFYRVDKSHSREIGGTGLGLSITRNAILMHRGAIKVYSKESEGTTFTVRVPLNYISQ